MFYYFQLYDTFFDDLNIFFKSLNYRYTGNYFRKIIVVDIVSAVATIYIKLPSSFMTVSEIKVLKF